MGARLPRLTVRTMVLPRRLSILRRRSRADDPVIDHIFRSPDGDEFVLVLVESRPWNLPGVLGELAERIDLCAGYVLEGRLAAEFPDTVGRTVRLHVDYLVPMTQEAESMFAQATEALAGRGLAFTAEWLDPDRS
jgi:hypothetical protein